MLLSILLLPLLYAEQTPDPRVLAADALTHIRASASAELNYTYLDTEHDTTHGGIFPSHHTTVSETIALLGTQYTRRIEKDGKPLSGKDLEHEQELYDEAIRQRRAVGDVRAEQKGIFQHKIAGLLDRMLKDFDIRTAGEEVIDGHLCTILLFEPSASAKPAPTSRVRWWVDAASHEVRQEERVLVAQEDTLLPGSLFFTHYAPVDGVMLPHDARQDVIFNEPAMKNMRIHAIVEHSMTNYRKFRTSVTITPAGDVPIQPPPE